MAQELCLNRSKIPVEFIPNSVKVLQVSFEFQQPFSYLLIGEFLGAFIKHGLGDLLHGTNCFFFLLHLSYS